MEKEKNIKTKKGKERANNVNTKQSETTDVVEKKSNKSFIIILSASVVCILIIGFLLWFLLRSFNVTFKYNNGDEDYKTKVRYNNLIKKEDIKENLTLKGSTFLGYFETYYLTEEQIKNITDDNKDSICKDKYHLSEDRVKCINDDPFDFENTKIKKNTIIEAIWSQINFTINPTNKTINIGNSFTIKATITGTNDKTVKWTSSNTNIAKVDGNGKVTGLKSGKVTITAKSNNITRNCTVTVKDNLTLKTSNSCVTGSNSFKVTASLLGDDNNLSWSIPECYNVQNNSNKEKTLTRKNTCTTSSQDKIIVKLPTGESATVTVNYEPKLNVTVYDNNNIINIDPFGYYDGNRIKIMTNVNATFTGNYIKERANNYVNLNNTCSTEITIKTSCGQTKLVKVNAVIN